MGNEPRVTVFLGLLAIGCWVGGAAGEEQNWITSKIETISIYPGSCATFGFKGGKESQYRVNLTQMHFPDGCNPDEHLKWTPNFYYRGECLRAEWDDPDECKIPSGKGIQDSSDMCINWDLLNTNMLGSSDEYVSKGTLCFDEENYFLAMNSTCTDTIEIEITVQTRRLTDDQVEACNLFQRFFEGAATTAPFSFVILIVIVIIKVSIFLCCCFCPGCPIYQSRMRRKQMAQNVDIIQFQTSQYTSSLPAASEPLPGYERSINSPHIAGVSPPPAVGQPVYGQPAVGQPAVNPFGAPGCT